MKQIKKIVVLGGSFNPPTLAHLKLIQTAMDVVSAEKGYLVPVSHAYLKRKMMKAQMSHLCLSDEMRIEMLQKMSCRDPRIEIHTGEMNSVIGATYQSMSMVQLRHPDAKVFFVMGADKLKMLDQFAEKNDFLDRFGVLVYARSGENPREEIVKYERLIPYMDAFVIVEQPKEIDGISSTAVRKHFFHIDEAADMLHPAVTELMKTLKAEDFPEEILRFKDRYGFLDPAYPSEVEFEGITYPSAEAAFQASKLKDAEGRKRFALYSADKVKQKGAAITPYTGWDEIKVDLMRQIQKEKFTRSEEMTQRLLRTRNKMIIAGNSRKETFWGMNLTSWEGENHLGRILMQLRSELNRKREV